MERFDPRVNNNGQRPAMPDRSMVSRPVHGDAGAPTPVVHSTTKKGNKRPRWAVVTAVIAVVVLLAGVGYYALAGNIGSQVNGTYQAVFLSNGEAYFGKITAINNSYVKLINVYFIQSKNTTGAATTNNVELSQLVKAVHGPKDEIIINRSQVLYFENLKDDGQAAKLMSGDKIDK